MLQLLNQSNLFISATIFLTHGSVDQACLLVNQNILQCESNRVGLSRSGKARSIEYVLGRSSTIFLDQIFGLAKCPFLGRPSFVQKVNILCLRLQFSFRFILSRPPRATLDRVEFFPAQESWCEHQIQPPITCIDANIGGWPGLWLCGWVIKLKILLIAPFVILHFFLLLCYLFTRHWVMLFFGFYVIFSGLSAQV